jgi:hypothetical protein
LQRRLRAAGTSFGEQLRRARINAAWQLVRFSDLKIDAIASHVGLGNSSRLGSIFRAELGMTAAQLRLLAHCANDSSAAAKHPHRPSEQMWPDGPHESPSKKACSSPRRAGLLLHVPPRHVG